MALPLDEALIKTASDALEAVLPNSGNHTVTASVRTRAGASFSGANVYSFTGGPCAELVALGVAAAGGVLAEDITTVVAVKKDSATGEIRVLNPCGRCRQVLFDYNDSLDVIVVDDGKIRTVSIRELLPFAYVTSKEGYD